MAAGDIKITYGTQQTPACTSLASLASSNTRVAGAEIAAIDNSSLRATDYYVSGIIKVSSTPPTDAKQIDVWIIPQLNDTPTYPDVFDGTDSAETVNSLGILWACGKIGASISTNNTADRIYPFGFHVRARCDYECPQRFSLFIAHDTGQNLASSGSAIYVQPIFENVAQS